MPPITSEMNAIQHWIAHGAINRSLYDFNSKCKKRDLWQDIKTSECVIQNVNAISDKDNELSFTKLEAYLNVLLPYNSQTSTGSKEREGKGVEEEIKKQEAPSSDVETSSDESSISIPRTLSERKLLAEFQTFAVENANHLLSQLQGVDFDKEILERPLAANKLTRAHFNALFGREAALMEDLLMINGTHINECAKHT